MTLHKEIFRAYDIRGIVDVTLQEDDVYQIGCAFSQMLKENNQHKVIVARDGRLSAPRLHAKLVQSLIDNGCEVIDIGVVPTPVLYFATNILDCPNGVMLTASHNPANYNGLKIVLNKLPLMPEQIENLYHLALNAKPTAMQTGSISNVDALALYEEKILGDIKLKRPLKVVIDCANGVAAVVAPQLLRKLGCEVVELFCELDGRFPNHAPDPSEIENLHYLIEAVKEHKADLGLAFDGDADRVMVIDEKGQLIFPDYLLMLYVQELAKRYQDFKVIHDVKCTRYLSQEIKKLGGVAIMARTGHSFMKVRMKEEQALIGGEASGHIFWEDRWYGVDDGIYSAIRLLEILAAENKALSSLMQQFPRGVETPEYKLAMSEDKKNLFMQQLIAQAQFPEASIITIDGLRVEFLAGWGLVRVSNTSPYLTFRFEANTKQDLNAILHLFRTQLLQLDKELVLPF